MLNVLLEFPDDILAVEWQGEVTAEDYRSVLVPAALAKIRQHGHLRMLAVLGPSFETITAGAMWEDAKLGFGHLSNFSRVAVVTDISWIRDSLHLCFAIPFGFSRMPTELLQRRGSSPETKSRQAANSASCRDL